jgi:hypothetical protein
MAERCGPRRLRIGDTRIGNLLRNLFQCRFRREIGRDVLNFG